jgi:hypothetical protein
MLSCRRNEPGLGGKTLLFLASVATLALLTSSCRESPGSEESVQKTSKSTIAGHARAPRGLSESDVKNLIAQAERNTKSKKQAYLDIVKKDVSFEETDLILSSILSTAGPGQERNDILQDFFFVAGLGPEDAFALRNKLNGVEKERASIGLACRIGLKSGTEFLSQLTSFQASLNPSELALIGSGLSLRVDQELSGRIFGYKVDTDEASQSDKDSSFRESFSTLEAILSKQDPKVALNVYSDFFENCAHSAPLAAWSEINKLAEDRPEFLKENPKLLQSVISSMAIQNPESTFAALSGARTLANSPDLQKYASVAFGSLLTNDSKAAFEWFEQHSASLEPKLVDGCNMAKANFYSKSADFELARKAASLLSNPELRSKAEGQVWEAERDALRKDIQTAPSKTIESIVSGKSKYAEYWLEESMSSWVGKDFEKAEAWYQSNWKSLPQNKSQYIAAAFANQAIKQGDAATARQWAAYIQDPKTRQRIEAGIAKAAEKKNQ